MDTSAQVIHDCETQVVIKQAKRMKPLSGGGRTMAKVQIWGGVEG